MSIDSLLSLLFLEESIESINQSDLFSKYVQIDNMVNSIGLIITLK